MTGQAGFDVLETIVAATRRRVQDASRHVPLATLERAAASRRPRADAFVAALARGPIPRIVAECKRRSPSRGMLRWQYDPGDIARAYEAAGAVAVSVLTEPAFFDGALDHLGAVREATTLPVLRKDFIVEEYQLVEARAAGADAILLIATALGSSALRRLLDAATALHLAAIVEVHDRRDLQAAREAGASVVGINSRNLRTLAVDLSVITDVLAAVDHDCLVVAESGLRSPEEIRALINLGADAFLIGERFMTAPSPGDSLAELIAAVRELPAGPGRARA